MIVSNCILVTHTHTHIFIGIIESKYEYLDEVYVCLANNISIISTSLNDISCDLCLRKIVFVKYNSIFFNQCHLNRTLQSNNETTESKIIINLEKRNCRLSQILLAVNDFYIPKRENSEFIALHLVKRSKFK